jgi:cytochrome c peroxidase
VVNAVFSAAKLCDGGADDQKIQVKGLVQAGVEMANEPENVVTLIQHAKLLRALRPCVGPQLPSVQYATIKRIESIS